MEKFEIVGWLIYDIESLERNKWFALEFINKAKLYDINLSIKLENEIINETVMPTFAIVRTRNSSITLYLENHNVKCFNNYITSRICNDKYETYKYFKEYNLPHMKTYRYEENELSFPYILKLVNGHGGTDVHLINDSSTLEKMKNSKGKYITQEICDTTGLDIRFYVLGNKIVKAIKRTSKEDFRSNYSLGGNCEIYNPSEEQIALIENITKNLQFDFVGIDLMKHQNKWVVNEIEDVVGCRMLYKLTDIDIVSEYIKYIKNKI